MGMFSNHLVQLATIVGLLFVFIFILRAKYGKNYVVKNAILIGLTGTFFGITLALFFTKFDYIASDLLPLFAGLKVATITTLLGMIYYLYAGKGELDDAANVSDNLLESLINALIDAKNQQRGLNDNLVKFLALQEKNYSISLSNDELIEILKRATEKLAEDLRKINLENAETVKRTLNDMMKELGTGLTDLSGKFVSDYKPLTEKLQILVAMAETLKDPKITKVIEK